MSEYFFSVIYASPSCVTKTSLFLSSIWILANRCISDRLKLNLHFEVTRCDILLFGLPVKMFDTFFLCFFKGITTRLPSTCRITTGFSWPLKNVTIVLRIYPKAEARLVSRATPILASESVPSFLLIVVKLFWFSEIILIIIFHSFQCYSILLIMMFRVGLA